MNNYAKTIEFYAYPHEVRVIFLFKNINVLLYFIYLCSIYFIYLCSFSIDFLAKDVYNLSNNGVVCICAGS